MRQGKAGPVPWLARLVLSFLLRGDDRRYALADLEQEFEEREERDGRWHAVRWYRGQVLRSVLPLLAMRLGRRATEGEVPNWMGRSGMLRNRLHDIVNDLRIAGRGLKRSPLVMIITVLSLGIGIGAVTSTFAVVNQLLLHAPTGIQEPERLVTLYTSEHDGGLYGVSSFPDYQDMKRGLEALDDAAAVSLRPVTLGDDDPRPLLAEWVTGNYFAVTGIRPVLGRAFLPEETVLGAAAAVAVLGYDLWVDQFGADPRIVGRTIRINGYLHTVVGVAPDGVVSRRAPLEPDVWIPVGTVDDEASLRAAAFDDRDARLFLILGRLADGATLEGLEAQVAVLGGRLREQFPDEWEDERGEQRVLTAVREKDSRLNPDARTLLSAVGAFFVGAAGLILLIACSNVASLFLANASRRTREMAIRVSLGASRRRLIAMFLTEGLIPGVASGLLGLWVTFWVAGVINSASLPVGLPIRLSVDVDGRVLLFAVAISLFASLAFGLVPAFEGSKPALVPALKGDAAGSGGRRSRLNLRNVLVVTQCAASVVLVVGATLFIRSLGYATETDLGIDPDRVAVATKRIDVAEYGPAEGIQYIADLRAELLAQPGVEDVQVARGVELTIFNLAGEVEVTVDGREAAAGESRNVFRNSVTPGYMDMLGIRVLQGRGISPDDVRGGPFVAVVNETFAERYWPGRSPLGRRFQIADSRAVVDQGDTNEPRTVEVVGVVRNGKYLDFDDVNMPFFYTSIEQDYASDVAVLVRGRESAAAMVPVLRETIDLSPGEVQLGPPSTLASQLSLQFIHLRLASKVLGWGGAFGMFLAIIGIYGIVSFAVTQRTREMAIRMALGAEKSQVVQRVVMDGVRLAGFGLLLGMVVALPVAHLVRSVLWGISPFDPVSFGGGALALLLAAVLASIVPARRVTGIDPMATLREE